VLQRFKGEPLSGCSSGNVAQAQAATIARIRGYENRGIL
jgi:hypothetical protein